MDFDNPNWLLLNIFYNNVLLMLL